VIIPLSMKLMFSYTGGTLKNIMLIYYATSKTIKDMSEYKLVYCSNAYIMIV